MRAFRWRGSGSGLAALGALLIGACADPGLLELEAYTNEVMARAPGPLEPIPRISLVDTFLYMPLDRRDPFLMDERAAEVVQGRNPDAISPDPLRRKEPLEAYSLDSLRMVGTLEQHQTRWALVVTPDGVLHRVRVGNYLGRNNGQIIRIEPGGLVLSEIVPAGPGAWEQRRASIALKD
jgi:type IV pilus assembly protein PilP